MYLNCSLLHKKKALNQLCNLIEVPLHLSHLALHNITQPWIPLKQHCNPQVLIKDFFKLVNILIHPLLQEVITRLSFLLHLFQVSGCLHQLEHQHPMWMVSHFILRLLEFILNLAIIHQWCLRFLNLHRQLLPLLQASQAQASLHSLPQQEFMQAP